MKKIILLGLAVISFTACHSQQRSKQDHSETSKISSAKTPHGQWTVHKEYDDQGRLIRKDSTYSYSYASVNGKEVPPEKMDSLFGQFHSQIRSNFSQMNIPNSMDMDSIEQSFFSQNSGDLQEMQKRMQAQMKAMQQNFARQLGHQDWIPKEENDSSSEAKKSEMLNTQKI